MKKTYQAPAVQTIAVKACHIICTSSTTMGFGSDSANGNTVADSRRRSSLWDNEEEEE